MKLRLNFFILFAFILLLIGAMGCNEFSQANINFTGNHVTFPDTSPQSVLTGNTFSITVTPDSGFTLITTVPSDCPAGSWSGNVYTTGIITSDCTLVFFATVNPEIVTSSGMNVSIDPSDPQVVDYGTTQSFTVTANTGYILSNTVEGTCPAGSWNGNIYTTGAITQDCTVIFSATQNSSGNTTLSVSVSELALSVTGLTEYGVSGTPSSGLARTITITNTGSAAAENLSITYPTWPSGTTASSTCGANLNASDSCSITITPGNTASSDGTNPCSSTGTTPLPGNISISADNASSVSTNLYILSYGCIYQGGYIYAFDDTTSTAASVGGKVATSSDQSSGIIWSSNSSGTYDGGVSLYGISETSTSSSPNPSSGQVSGQTACNGATDGSCDTNNIYAYYQNFATGAPINTSDYAAGLCKQTISGYSDWYLPSICEMGPDTTSAGTGCGAPASPTLQNIQSNLVDYNSLNLLSGAYWTSTELSIFPIGVALYENFASGSGDSQGGILKSNLLGVRCSRGF